MKTPDFNSHAREGRDIKYRDILLSHTTFLVETNDFFVPILMTSRLFQYIISFILCQTFFRTNVRFLLYFLQIFCYQCSLTVNNLIVFRSRSFLRSFYNIVFLLFKFLFKIYLLFKNTRVFSVFYKKPSYFIDNIMVIVCYNHVFMLFTKLF